MSTIFAYNALYETNFEFKASREIRCALTSDVTANLLIKFALVSDSELQAERTKLMAIANTANRC